MSSSHQNKVEYLPDEHCNGIQISVEPSLVKRLAGFSSGASETDTRCPARLASPSFKHDNPFDKRAAIGVAKSRLGRGSVSLVRRVALVVSTAAPGRPERSYDRARELAFAK